MVFLFFSIDNQFFVVCGVLGRAPVSKCCIKVVVFCRSDFIHSLNGMDMSFEGWARIFLEQVWIRLRERSRRVRSHIFIPASRGISEIVKCHLWRHEVPQSLASSSPSTHAPCHPWCCAPSRTQKLKTMPSTCPLQGRVDVPQDVLSIRVGQ